MQVPEGLDSGVDQLLPALPVGHVVGVGDGLATGGLDLVNDLLGGGAVVSGAVHRAAQIVDDDLCALLGEEQRVLAADAAPGAGDDGNASVQCTHESSRTESGKSARTLLGVQVHG